MLDRNALLEISQKHTAVGCTKAYTVTHCAKQTSQNHTKQTTRDVKTLNCTVKKPTALIFTETLYTQMNSNVLH